MLSNNNYNNSSWHNKSPEPKNNYQNNLYKVNSNVENYNYTPMKLNRGYSSENIYDSNRLKSYNKTRNNVSSYGSSTMAGTNAYGVTKTNQDSYLIKQDKVNSGDIEYTFGVFDGHGLQGHLVSDEIRNYLMNVKFDQYYSKQSIVSMFNSLSKSIENSKNFDPFCSGSTAVITHITKDKIICANCGDSRAILIGENGIVKISRDHKPELRDEKKRIIASGGRVDRIYGMGPYRVWFKDGDYPGLAMSRSIGDTLAHRIGVSSIPEIKEFNINNVKPIAIVVASDGVWEFMSNEQVKNILIKYKYDQDALRCSKEIVERARQIWKGTSYAIDDITCITAFFDKN